jgi:lipopolysaccharide biosynthesis glycosyltransferase
LSGVWTIQDVEYISKASPWFYWDYHKSRFKEVFTKLRILKDLHGVFKKIVLLDLDLLIRGEVDSLFELPAPAALVRGQYPLRHGEVVPIDTFYSAHRQVIGINCGVMLVEPNAKIFERMIKEVESYFHPEHWPSHGPEQDYLSRFYNAYGQWANMSCRYNYQVHLTQFGSTEWHHYNIKGHPDVSIFHFSGRLVKPWSILLDLLIAHEMSYDEIEVFVREIAKNAVVELERINAMLNQEGPVTSDASATKLPSEDVGEEIESHFCYGTGPHQKKSKRCYLDRYIHPSWSEADSESCIEFIRSFREADESQSGSVTQFLRRLWCDEKTRRLNNLDS